MVNDLGIYNAKLIFLQHKQLTEILSLYYMVDTAVQGKISV